MKKLVLASIVAAVSLVSFSALAQTDAKKVKATSIETYDFPDDKLLNVKGETGGMTIGGDHRVVRVILARPRLHFVPELLKTIENL